MDTTAKSTGAATAASLVVLLEQPDARPPRRKSSSRDRMTGAACPWWVEVNNP